MTLILTHSPFRTTGVGGYEFQVMALDSRWLCYRPHIPPLPAFPAGFLPNQVFPGLTVTASHFLSSSVNSEWQVLLTTAGEAVGESRVGRTLSHSGELGEGRRPLPQDAVGACAGMCQPSEELGPRSLEGELDLCSFHFLFPLSAAVKLPEGPEVGKGRSRGQLIFSLGNTRWVAP